MIREISLARRLQGPLLGVGACEHRAVSKEGRIVCRKIVEGDNQVSPEVCRTCPLKAVNCAHLRCSLRQRSPSPLIVRFAGRTEVWDDGPAAVQFEQAACALKVVPLEGTRACAACGLRQTVQAGAAEEWRRRPVAGEGKVVAFPGREVLAAAG